MEAIGTVILDERIKRSDDFHVQHVGPNARSGSKLAAVYFVLGMTHVYFGLGGHCPDEDTLARLDKLGVALPSRCARWRDVKKKRLLEFAMH